MKSSIQVDVVADRIRTFVTFSTSIGRTELAANLDLPRPTVVSAVRRMVEAGDLIEVAAEPPRSRAGRPPRVLRVAGPSTLIGVLRWDGGRLGGVCIDTAGRILQTVDLEALDPRAGIDGLQRAVERVVALAAEQQDGRLRLVVLGVPAPFLSGRGAPREHALLGAGPTPFPVITPGDLETLLTQRYQVRVVIENDANLAALGELYAGAARGVRNAVYLMVKDQGFGSALVVNGALARGARGYAGELAHVQVDARGPLCACGGRGCLLHQIREAVVESAQSAYAEPITFADLPRLAAAGDLGAARMMRDIGRALGDPLARLCTFLDPEILLVGGTLGPAADEVITGIREMLALHAPPAIADNVDVRTAGLGSDAELIGAVEIGRLSARPSIDR